MEEVGEGSRGVPVHEALGEGVAGAVHPTLFDLGDLGDLIQTTAGK